MHSDALSSPLAQTPRFPSDLAVISHLEAHSRSAYARFRAAKGALDQAGMAEAVRELKGCYQEAKQAARHDAELAWRERRAAVFPHDPEALSARITALSYDLYLSAKRELGHGQAQAALQS